MEWQDEAIILGTRRHGETGTIIEVMTAGHGRHLGLVRGGRSRQMRPVLQPGNEVLVTWRARLEEHLGTFRAEPIRLNAGRLLGSPVAVYGLQLMGAHVRCLPERDPHPALHATLKVLVDHLDQPMIAAEIMARLEVSLLEELGFGLDLAECAATGSRDDLAFVSPKSGRAVSREAGAPWADRLFELPDFLRVASGVRADAPTLRQAFRLTGHFLARHVWDARAVGEPPEREAFLAAVLRNAQSNSRQGGNTLPPDIA